MKTSLLSLWSLLFLTVWIVSSLGSYVFYFISRNASLKRMLLLPVVSANVLLFMVFLWFPEGSVDGLWIGVPAAVLISLFAVRRVRFCSRCGSTFGIRTPHHAGTICYECASELQ